MLDKKDIQIISDLLDSKLNPIVRTIESIKIDINLMKDDVKSINIILG